MSDKRSALGRGLSALIPEAAHRRQTPVELDVELLVPNPHQPRSRTDDSSLDELARSIRSNGIIQPILVRHTGRGYEIVAGERRWRAAQRAGLAQVPVVIRDVPDDRLLEVALIENIQREDLNPIEEAQAYQRLSDEFHLRQDEIALAVGRDRSSIANLLRLLRLPDDVKASVAEGSLSMGHARALLGVDDPTALQRTARDVVARGLSVRDTEALVRRLHEGRAAPKPRPEGDVHTRAAEEQLKLALGATVHIVRKGKHGRIEILFTSETELHRLYEQLTASKTSRESGALSG